MTVDLSSTMTYQYLADNIPPMMALKSEVLDIEATLIRGLQREPKETPERQTLAELSEKVHTLIQTKILPLFTLLQEIESKIANGEVDPAKELSELHAIIVETSGRALFCDTMMSAVEAAQLIWLKELKD